MVKIALISDTHLAERATEFNTNFRAAMQWISRNDIASVIHLGDITADGANNFREFEEVRTITDCYPINIQFLPGNHDIGDNPTTTDSASGQAINSDRLVAYRSAFYPDYWSTDTGGWHLIGLNAQLFGADTCDEYDQFHWLSEDLKINSGPIGLFIHKPLFYIDPEEEGLSPRYVPPAARTLLLDIFRHFDLRFVVSGHVHQKRRFSSHGIDHIWMPSASFIIPDYLQDTIGEKETGIAILELERDRYNIEFVKPDGMNDLVLTDYPHVYSQVADLRQV